MCRLLDQNRDDVIVRTDCFNNDNKVHLICHILRDEIFIFAPNIHSDSKLPRDKNMKDIFIYYIMLYFALG
jgi:hypothetical protein